MLANMVEQAIGARIMHPWNIGFIFEEQHLRRFLHHFEVDCVFDVRGTFRTICRSYMPTRDGNRGRYEYPSSQTLLPPQSHQKTSAEQELVCEGDCVPSARLPSDIQCDGTRPNEFAARQPQFIETDLFRIDGAKILPNLAG